MLKVSSDEKRIKWGGGDSFNSIQSFEERSNFSTQDSVFRWSVSLDFCQLLFIAFFSHEWLFASNIIIGCAPSLIQPSVHYTALRPISLSIIREDVFYRPGHCIKYACIKYATRILREHFSTKNFQWWIVRIEKKSTARLICLVEIRSQMHRDRIFKIETRFNGSVVTSSQIWGF